MTGAEQDTHLAVVHLLRSSARHNIVWFHVANGEARDAITGAKLKRMGVIPGVPDFILIVDGKTYGLEIKSNKGSLSAPQKVFREAMENAGGFYRVAKSVDAAIVILSGIGALRIAPRQGAAS